MERQSISETAYHDILEPSYEDFLKSKIIVTPERGAQFNPDINPKLFWFQQAICRWAIRGGNRAIFANFGLGKTNMQIQICKAILDHVDGSGVIICPLGVKDQFVQDAKKFFGLHFQYVRTNEEHARMTDEGQRYFLTNYERVRDGAIYPNRFQALSSLDEADVLRSFGSKTYQTFLTLFDKVPFKYVCTATPSPNRYKELIHYAGFLGIMDTGQALTRWFKRDSSQAGNLKLHPHKEREFWLWVSTWAAFLTKPSDICLCRERGVVCKCDEGYDLPPLHIHRHRLPVDHSTAGYDSWGQGKLLRNAATSLREGAREKRDSMEARIQECRRIIDNEPLRTHWIIWHSLEDERRAIEQEIPEAVTVYGTQDLEEREEAIRAFSDGESEFLATKLSIAGSGTNLQRHCHRAIYLGLDFKFRDFIQGVHRIYRFLQANEVHIYLIYTESEDPIFEELMRKWDQDRELRKIMTDIIRKYGLNNAGAGAEMQRSIGLSRQEVKGERFTAVNNDNIPEMAAMPENSIDLLITSVPFSDHYEYTELYNDFGHNDGDEGFFAQMDFLTPEILRTLKPGRLACIHVKDRIVYGSVSNLGMYSVNPFSDKCVAHFRKHGLIYCGRITIVTDVVRENNQTYRLGWTENSKDGTKMGVGSPEYVLLFRKLPSDLSKSYADQPVIHEKPMVECSEHDWTEGSPPGPCKKCGTPFGTMYATQVPFQDGLPMIPGTGYSRGRWQFDAHSFWRSSGNRFLSPEEIGSMRMDDLRRLWRQYASSKIYDFQEHVRTAEEMEKRGILPSSFMALDPPNPGSEWVWDDVTRMRTLNTEQSRGRLEQHICPLQLDVVERLIERYSNPGELVLDPFAGIFTVPYVAVNKQRRGFGIELNADYFHDGVSYCRAAEVKVTSPTLFDVLDSTPAFEPPFIATAYDPNDRASMQHATEVLDDAMRVANETEIGLQQNLQQFQQPIGLDPLSEPGDPPTQPAAPLPYNASPTAYSALLERAHREASQKREPGESDDTFRDRRLKRVMELDLAHDREVLQSANAAKDQPTNSSRKERQPKKTKKGKLK